MDDQGQGFISIEDKTTLIELDGQRSNILQDREETWRLRSRAISLKVGDDNTKFFHNYAKGRRACNTIWKIPTNHGKYAQTFHQLAYFGNSHFQQLFKAPLGTSLAEIICIAGHFPQYVDPNIYGYLTKPISMGQLESTLKWFKKDKSLGHDGWSVEFYLAFFGTLGIKLLKVVEECRITRRMYDAINSTFISLIPKLDSPQSSNDF